MALHFGLNIKKNAPQKPVFFDEGDEDDNEDADDRDGPSTNKKGETIEEITTFGGNDPPSRFPRSHAPAKQAKGKSEAGTRKRDGPTQNLSAMALARRQVEEAEQIDASIFDYDSFHDAKTSVTEAKKEAARQDAIERKPKYIDNLLNAAARRKQDQLIAQEKLLQKEREAEGDEFADKEKFVTGAYKAQQEEAKRLEEEEKRKAEIEEKRKEQLGGGMQGFYRSMMDQSERQHQEAMEVASKMNRDGTTHVPEQLKRKTDVELAAEMKAKGIDVHVNEDGQLVDKRELLSAGLNVAPAGRSGDVRNADHLKTSNRVAQPSSFTKRGKESQQAQRERQTKMMEEQLAAHHKRAREEADEEQRKIEKAAKSSKSEKDVSDAKARYLARKAAKARGEG
nr:nuclear speckle splicing regulatory protein 1 like [Quercus suber]